MFKCGICGVSQRNSFLKGAKVLQEPVFKGEGENLQVVKPLIVEVVYPEIEKPHIVVIKERLKVYNGIASRRRKNEDAKGREIEKEVKMCNKCFEKYNKEQGELK